MLNVKCEATSGDIKKSFRKRALIVHPDKPGGDHKLFQTLSEAFEVLSDQQARTAYDASQHPVARVPRLAASADSPLSQHGSRATAKAIYPTRIDPLLNELLRVFHACLRSCIHRPTPARFRLCTVIEGFQAALKTTRPCQKLQAVVTLQRGGAAIATTCRTTVKGIGTGDGTNMYSIALVVVSVGISGRID